MTDAAPTAPLDGVRVLDLSRVLAGPYCAMMLADLGAEVIKVERPDGGDITRAWGPPWAGGEATYYLGANRGKRSIAIDLRDMEGVEIVRRLASRSDVVIENFIPGGADRLGLGWENLRAGNPTLVYCSISGYPHDGPQAALPGFDFAIQGEGGIMSITGAPDGDPMKVGVAIADITAGMYAASGILAALVAVRGGAHGRWIRVSLFDSQLAWLANRGTEASIAGETPARLGNAHPSIVPYETFPTQDAPIIIAVGTDAQFQALCAAVDAADIAADGRYATNPDRVAHRETLIPALGERTATFAADDLLTRLERANVPSGPVRTIPEALAAAPFALRRFDHPTAGPIDLIRSPIALDNEHRTADLPPPLLGQHTEQILREAGYDDLDIARLQEGPCALPSA